NHQALGGSSTCKPIGVVVDTGRVADEKCVKLSQPAIVSTIDNFSGESRVLRGSDKLSNGFLIRRRVFFTGVSQDSQIIATGRPRHRPGSLSSEIFLRKLGDIFSMMVRNLR